MCVLLGQLLDGLRVPLAMQLFWRSQRVCCQTGTSAVFGVTHTSGLSAESHQPLTNSVLNNVASDEAENMERL